MGTPIGLLPDFKVLYRGPQVVWGFITIPYLCHALLLYLRLCEEYLYWFGSWNVFAVSTSLVTFSGSRSFTAIDTNLESVSEPASFVAGSLMGWPPEIIYESCDCFVVKASLGFDLVFPRLIVCVAICAPLQGKSF